MEKEDQKKGIRSEWTLENNVWWIINQSEGSSSCLIGLTAYSEETGRK